MNAIIFAPILIAVVSGVYLLISSFIDHVKGRGTPGQPITEEQKRRLHIFVLSMTFLIAALVFYIVLTAPYEYHLLTFVGDLTVYFYTDNVSRLFATVTTVAWVFVGIYATEYMEHGRGEKRFYGFYLLLFGVLLGRDFAGNLITMYLFYELMTITSVPLVLHNRSKQAIIAAMKYLLFSMAGAYSALFGIFVLYKYCGTLNFVAGGSLEISSATGQKWIVLIAIFCMIVGFGAKAGMLPLHGWLPIAHPVAPAPASAVLSAVIVKGGVLALIRTVYYVVGPDFIRGTWVQYAWMTLCLITVFMGSLLAFREQQFKKRLAYSTVSQVSYILFGLATLSTVGLTGALLHYVYHSIIKTALFLTAGIIIYRSGKKYVYEYDGIGRRMPMTLWAYTGLALALIGIPPTCGFISKWYLAQGALGADIGVFRYLGPAVLLVSALLTAGYLLPITIQGFLPGKDCTVEHKWDKFDRMGAVVLILSILALLLGMFPNSLIQYVSDIAASLV